MSNRVGVVVACRMKSSRLPQKAILPIAGVASVERCLLQCLAVPGVDKVVLATSDLPEDGVLGDYLCDDRAAFWAGDSDDVISRYLGACDNYGFDVVIRVTADCPLISYEIAEYLLDQHLKSGADFTTASAFAVGTACEIIQVSALKSVIEALGEAEYSEYMSWYFTNNPDFFNINIVNLPKEMIRDYRLTLDYQEDLEVFEKIYQKIGGSATACPIAKVFDVLDSDPSISRINQHLTLKYKTDDDLISILNNRTRISSGRFEK